MESRVNKYYTSDIEENISLSTRSSRNTNLYKEISTVALMLGFFFTVNGILNIIETLGNIKFCK